MKASIIVRTDSRSQLLRKLLASLCLQHFPLKHFEIIVVGSSTTDDTEKVLRSISNEYPYHSIHYLCEPESGLLPGRHRGALKAKGELLIFVDDDIEAVDEWLAAIVSGFDDRTVQLIGGRNLPNYEVSPPGWIESFWTGTPYGGSSCYYLSLLDFGPSDIKI